MNFLKNTFQFDFIEKQKFSLNPLKKLEMITRNCATSEDFFHGDFLESFFFCFTVHRFFFEIRKKEEKLPRGEVMQTQPSIELSI